MLQTIPSLSATIPNAPSLLNAALNSSGSLSPLSSSVNAAAVVPETPFSSLLTDAIGQVNTLETQAREAIHGLISGAGVDVHQAMIATEKSGMAFELALAVRNKAVQAYQSVIGMQF